MAPARSYGLPWHLIYPLAAMILVAIPAFSSANSIHFVSANSPTMQIRFGSKSYCGYNITQTEGVQKHEPLDCVSAGFSYTIDQKAMSMYLPSAITVSLSKAAAMLIVSFVFLILAILLQVWTTVYSNNGDPNKDRLYTLVLLHYTMVIALTFYSWLCFIVLAAVCGSASNASGLTERSIVIWWGNGCWLVLAAAVSLLPWAYEAVRWRNVENHKFD